MNRVSCTIKMFVLFFLTIFILDANAWENKLTHPKITQKAIERSVLAGDYLQKQLGLNDKLDANLMLLEHYQNNLIRRAGQVRPHPMPWNENKLSILEWIKTGSEFEDIPNPRARHHFYDPLRNGGLNNTLVDTFSGINDFIWLGSKAFYPDYWGFDVTGGSAVKRSLGITDDWGIDWESEPEYLVKYNWPTARDLFYYALVSEQKEERERILGSMFLVLGHICHLIEDQGVPAHTRNDFVWGHLVGHNYKKETGVKDPWKIGGNPFEAWMEEQIKNNDSNIPGIYLARLMDTPPAFNEFMGYWDIGICELSGDAQWQGDNPGWPSTGFGNPPPERSWGLAECTSYQFLSYNTIFRNSLSVQYYPHPAKNHTRVDWYPTGPDGVKQYYRCGYDVPHLTRSTLTAYLLGDLAFWHTDTTEEERVFEDYAKRTISRTVDYTTGLINYFFRGKLSIEQTDCNNGKIVITITNKSDNSGVGQTLKGGFFTLYWDDLSGNRTQVSDFNVYQPGTEPQPGNEWNSTTLLDYNESTKAVLTPAELNDVNYILVYEGIISVNPDSPDLDDTHQIATTAKRLCRVCCGGCPSFSYFKVTFHNVNVCPYFEDCGIDVNSLLEKECILNYSRSKGVYRFFCGSISGWNITVACNSSLPYAELNATFYFFNEDAPPQCRGEEIPTGEDNAMVFSATFNPRAIDSPLDNICTLSNCGQGWVGIYTCIWGEQNNVFKRVGYGGYADISVF